MPEIQFRFAVQGQQNTAAALARMQQQAQQLRVQAQGQLSAWQQVYGNIGQNLKAVNYQLTTLQNGQIRVNQSFTAGNQIYSKNKLGLLELSRGFEDFSTMVGTQGLAGGLRGALNNISQFATVAGGPVIGAVAGIAGGITLVLLPALEKLSRQSKINIQDMLDLVDAQKKIQLENNLNREKPSASMEHQEKLQEDMTIEQAKSAENEAKKALADLRQEMNQAQQQQSIGEFALQNIVGLQTADNRGARALTEGIVGEYFGTDAQINYQKYLEEHGAGVEKITKEDIEDFLKRVSESGANVADSKKIFYQWQANRAKRYGGSGAIDEAGATEGGYGAVPKEVMETLIKTADEIKEARRKQLGTEDKLQTAEERLADFTAKLAETRQKAMTELMDTAKGTVAYWFSEKGMAEGQKIIQKKRKEFADTFSELTNDADKEEQNSEEYRNAMEKIKQAEVMNEITPAEAKSARNAIEAREGLRKLGNKGEGFLAPERESKDDLTGKFVGMEELYKRIQESAASTKEDDAYVRAMKEHREQQRKEAAEAAKQRESFQKTLDDNLPVLKDIKTRLEKGIVGVVGE